MNIILNIHLEIIYLVNEYYFELFIRGLLVTEYYAEYSFNPYLFNGYYF